MVHNKFQSLNLSYNDSSKAQFLCPNKHLFIVEQKVKIAKISRKSTLYSSPWETEPAARGSGDKISTASFLTALMGRGGYRI